MDPKVQQIAAQAQEMVKSGQMTAQDVEQQLQGKMPPEAIAQVMQAVGGSGSGGGATAGEQGKQPKKEEVERGLTTLQKMGLQPQQMLGVINTFMMISHASLIAMGQVLEEHMRQGGGEGGQPRPEEGGPQEAPEPEYEGRPGGEEPQI